MELFDFLKDYITQSEGFIKYLPLDVLEIKEGYIKARLNPVEDNKNPFGTIHGGCYYAVADTIAGTACMTYGSYVTTTSGHMHYLRAVPVNEPLVIETQQLKVGNNLMTYDVLFYNTEKQLVCKATLEYYVLEKMKLGEVYGI